MTFLKILKCGIVSRGCVLDAEDYKKGEIKKYEVGQ